MSNFKDPILGIEVEGRKMTVSQTITRGRGSIKIKIPWVGEAEWMADPSERKAAWSLYVELVTRVAIQALPSGEGMRASGGSPRS